jgi:hypothetical protein
VDLDAATRHLNRGMIAFDLALGTGALLAPDATLRLLGHAQPSPDTRALFRRNGPVWLTFAAGHAVAAVRGEPRDWWGLAWLGGPELLTDVVWSSSPAIPKRSARVALRAAGVGNLAMALRFGRLGRR